MIINIITKLKLPLLYKGIQELTSFFHTCSVVIGIGTPKNWKIFRRTDRNWEEQELDYCFIDGFWFFQVLAISVFSTDAPAGITDVLWKLEIEIVSWKQFLPKLSFYYMVDLACNLNNISRVDLFWENAAIFPV